MEQLEEVIYSYKSIEELLLDFPYYKYSPYSETPNCFYCSEELLLLLLNHPDVKCNKTPVSYEINQDSSCEGDRYLVKMFKRLCFKKKVFARIKNLWRKIWNN